MVKLLSRSGIRRRHIDNAVETNCGRTGAAYTKPCVRTRPSKRNAGRGRNRPNTPDRTGELKTRGRKKRPPPSPPSRSQAAPPAQTRCGRKGTRSRGQDPSEKNGNTRAGGREN